MRVLHIFGAEGGVVGVFGGMVDRRDGTVGLRRARDRFRVVGERMMAFYASGAGGGGECEMMVWCGVVWTDNECAM